MISKKVIFGVGVLAIAVGSGFFFWKRQGDTGASYKEVKVKKGEIQISVLSTGTIQPENRLEIKPPIAGRVEKVLVKEGQPVRKGQTLAWMSSTERAAMLDAASSKGKEELQRWEELYRPTPVLAPINGTIILRNVESGQTFTNNDSILVMSDRLTVKAQVDETDISKIKTQQRAVIVLDAYPGEKIDAVVDKIAYDSKTVNNVTTYIVDVLPDSPPQFMRSGMTANVTFAISAKTDILTVPNEAIKAQDGRNTVMVKAEGGGVEKEIEIGLTDGKRTEVKSGLAEDDTVLVAQMKAKEKAGANPFNPMGARRPRGVR